MVEVLGESVRSRRSRREWEKLGDSRCIRRECEQ